MRREYLAASLRLQYLWRSVKSVKHEDVYLKGYASIPELILGPAEYFMYYNTEWSHNGRSHFLPNKKAK